jgi:hypothetical protein
MIIRALLADDWTFGLGKQNYLFGQQAIAENIQTRLYEFLNDAFWNMPAGLDWPRLFGTPGTKQEITLTCRSIILASFGVTAVNSIQALVDAGTRNLVLSFNINTIYTNNFSIQLQLNIAKIWGSQ